MMTTKNLELMKMARESLKDKWGIAIATFLIYALIIGIVKGSAETYTFVNLILLLISGPLSLGITKFTINIARNQEARIEQLFDGFTNFKTSTGAYLLTVLFTLLWTLLLIIPGIIAALSYSMTFYIIADDDSIGAMDAIDKSKKMMYGYKWKYFCLGLRIFGLALLCILTLGIGFLWLFPYANVSIAKFYDDIKENQITA